MNNLSPNWTIPDTPRGAYLANISVRHTAADAAGSMVWAMHNRSVATKVVVINSVQGVLSFDGTAAAANGVGYELVTFTGAEPTSGTTVPRVKKSTDYPNSVLLDASIQQRSGVLTMTGIANIEIVAVLRLPIAVTNGSQPFALSLGVELGADRGFGIRVGPVAAVIGQTLGGIVDWYER